LVDIEGHTDNIGKADDNLQLSQNRADACKQYLVKKGIEESRISSVGYGDMRPIADNATEEGRAKNRRTEFNIRNH
jgi:outer membrane protein OmpA-like peptidoglycan-associated protein